MANDELQIQPVNSQVRYRATSAPPSYGLFTADVAGVLAGRLAEACRLGSRDLVFNQATASNSYLVFRQFVAAGGVDLAQFSYLDVSIGLDISEVCFVNPRNAATAKEQLIKIWKPVMEVVHPTLTEHFFDIQVHGRPIDADANEFMDRLVPTRGPGNLKVLARGVSTTFEYPTAGANTQVAVQNSLLVPGGFFITLSYSLAKRVADVSSLEALFDSTIDVYRNLPPAMQIAIREQA